MSLKNGVTNVRLEIDTSGSGALWLIIVTMANNQDILVWSSGMDPFDPEDLFQNLVLWTGELIGVKLDSSYMMESSRSYREVHYPLWAQRGLKATRWVEHQILTLLERYPDATSFGRAVVLGYRLLRPHKDDHGVSAQ